MENGQGIEVRNSPSSKPARRAKLSGLAYRLRRLTSKPADHIQERIESEEPPRTGKLGQLFMAMPVEVRITILSHMEPINILSIHLASKTLSDFLQAYASSILPTALRRCFFGEDPLYLNILYPLPSSDKMFDFFLHMVYREKIVEEMVAAVVQYFTVPCLDPHEVAKHLQRQAELEREMKPSAFLVYHYLEKYRAAVFTRRLRQGGPDHMHYSESFVLRPWDDEPYMIKPSSEIVADYPSEKIDGVLLFHENMTAAFGSRLETWNFVVKGSYRPVIDRRIKRFLMVGGMAEMLKLMRHANPNTRYHAVGLAVARIKYRCCRPSPPSESELVEVLTPPTEHIQFHVPPRQHKFWAWRNRRLIESEIAAFEDEYAVYPSHGPLAHGFRSQGF